MEEDYKDLEETPELVSEESDSALDMSTAYGTSKREEVGEVEAPDLRNTSGTKEPSQEFRDWVNRLLVSKKGGFGGKNSARFERVHQALVDAVGALMGSFGTDSKRNIKMLVEAQTACNALLAACQQYTSRKPNTPAGKARRNLVLQIQALAAKDALGFGDAMTDFCGMSPEEQSGQTWASVLGKARSVSLTVEDFSKLDRPGGGQVSQVFKVQGKYFKPEDSFNVDAGVGQSDSTANRFIALSETLERFPKLSQDDIDELKRMAANPTSGGSVSDKAAPALAFFCKRAEELSVLVNEVLMPQGIVAEGGMTNTTRRNVATSRMAELLGLGHLVAKSQTAEIQDQATGKIIRGNLMDAAQGEEFSKVQNTIVERNVNAFTSGAARDITNLQVLDMLCGQVDRHAKNMLYQTNAGGQITGIQGIDNDASFGTNVDSVSGKDANRKDARVFDFRDGEIEMVLPYMDKALADRIEQLDSSVLRYALSDLLKEAEIEAAVQRLENMKAGIAHAKKTSPERFLENETDWTTEVMQGMLQKNKEMANQWTIGYNDEQLFEKLTRQLYSDEQLIADVVFAESNIIEFNKKRYPEERKKKIMDARLQVQRLRKKYLMSKSYGGMTYFGRYLG